MVYLPMWKVKIIGKRTIEREFEHHLPLYAYLRELLENTVWIKYCKIQIFKYDFSADVWILHREMDYNDLVSTFYGA